MQWRRGRFSLPGYHVEELVGFGGSGEVWRARDASTGEVVALKRLRADAASATSASVEPAEQRQLQREAALLATVRHDHIVALRSVVSTSDGLVLVLDYAEGGSLAALLGVRGQLSAGEVVTIGAPLAQALADIHARGLTHGDVTPGNIVFDGSGKPLLADLGVAKPRRRPRGPDRADAGLRRPDARRWSCERPPRPGCRLLRSARRRPAIQRRRTDGRPCTWAARDRRSGRHWLRRSSQGLIPIPPRGPTPRRSAARCSPRARPSRFGSHGGACQLRRPRPLTWCRGRCVPRMCRQIQIRGARRACVAVGRLVGIAGRPGVACWSAG